MYSTYIRFQSVCCEEVSTNTLLKPRSQRLSSALNSERFAVGSVSTAVMVQCLSPVPPRKPLVGPFSDHWVFVSARSPGKSMMQILFSVLYKCSMLIGSRIFVCLFGCWLVAKELPGVFQPRGVVVHVTHGFALCFC